jgi:hypothetical protein
MGGDSDRGGACLVARPGGRAGPRGERLGNGARRWSGPLSAWLIRLVVLAAIVLPPVGVKAQEGCRLPSDAQLAAGGALEGVLLVLHGLREEPVPLEEGVAYGDPGPCPGGSRDAFRGIDIMGWVLEVSGPVQPDLCSPDDPPITELPLRTTRCVDPSTTVASRSARVPYPELITRAPFPLLLPTQLPDGLEPHWTTLRVTDRRADGGQAASRQYGAIIRYRGAQETPWLLLLLDTGTGGTWLLDQLRANAPTLPVRGTQAAVLDTLPDYDGPGTGLLWEEAGVRLLLFGTYSATELARIAERLAPPAVPGGPATPTPAPRRR